MIHQLRRLAVHPIPLILFGALVLRISAAVLLDSPLRSDAAEYAALARSTLSGVGFSLEGAPTAHRMPGYPLVVAGVLLVTGESLTAVRLLQALVDTLTCLLVFLIGRRLSDERTGLITSLVYALFPLQIIYVSSVMTEATFTFLLCATVALMLASGTSRQRIFAAGLVGGVAALFKPLALLLPVLVPFVPALFHQPNRLRLWMLISFCAGMMLVISPWLVRNYLVFDRVALTSSIGVNFWIGNHTGSHGGYAYPEGNPLTGYRDEFERSDAGIQLGLVYWAEKSGEAIIGLGKKHAQFFGIDYWILTSSFCRNARASFQRASSLYAEIPPWSIILTHIPMVGVVLFSLVTLVGTPPQRRERWLMITFLILVWLGVHLVFFGSARFRFPLHPFLILAATDGWMLLHNRSVFMTSSRIVLFILLSFLLVAGWMAELWILSSLP
jgi:4-amino-4-deoxy-L-arabinose transferase-like glycosyltransferase